MSKRPYIWHASKFDKTYKGPYPWSVTVGRPTHEGDWVMTAKTLAEAVDESLKLVPNKDGAPSGSI